MPAPLNDPQGSRSPPRACENGTWDRRRPELRLPSRQHSGSFPDPSVKRSQASMEISASRSPHAPLQRIPLHQRRRLERGALVRESQTAARTAPSQSSRSLRNPCRGGGWVSRWRNGRLDARGLQVVCGRAAPFPRQRAAECGADRGALA